MLPFFQNPLGRKIIVPRADHAIRWAMQPGAPASRNRASAASSSTHPRPLCGLPEKGSPFLRLIPLPPFCCAGPSYAPQAPIVQPARLWYNKTLRDTLCRENDFMLTITLLGTAATMPLPDRALSAAFAACGGHGLLWDCGEGTQAAAHRAGVNLMRADAICLTHYHGDHIFGLPGLLQTLGAQGRTRPLALLGPEGLPDIWAAGPAAGAGCAERGLACRCAAGAVCHKAPGKKPWLPAGAAPCRQIFAGAGPGAGGAGAAMEAAAERAERCRGGQNGAACAGAGRPALGVERGIFRRYGPLPVLFAGGA